MGISKEASDAIMAMPDEFKASNAAKSGIRDSIRQMTVEEAKARLEKVRQDLVKNMEAFLGKEEPTEDVCGAALERDMSAFLGEESTTDTIGGKATRAQPAALPPQKNQPAKDIWTVKPGQSASFLVPHEVNPRHRSPQRRYRDKEVPHGFPVANLREFFFFSRRIASAAYDAPSRRLFLKFDASTLYQYFDVPEKVARDLLDMVSPASYANRHICYSFKYERLPFPPPQQE